MPGVEVQGVEGMKGLVGKEIGPSESRSVTQADIDTFAIATVSNACFIASISSTLSPRPAGRT